MKLKTEVYLNVAKEVSRLSKDKNTHVGCVIIDKEGKVVSTGRNGSISGVDDSKIPYSREVETLYFTENRKRKKIESNKYPFMCHSEINATLFTDDRSRLIGATIYVTGLPCNNCALMIAQSKLAKVVIPEEQDNIKMLDEQSRNITKYIFAVAGVRLFMGDKEIKLKVL